jgi:hypothetical protein
MGQGPVTIIVGPGNKEYELAPLRMKDMGAIEQFCKAQHRKDGLDFIREAGDLLTTQERKQMIRDLGREISGVRKIVIDVESDQTSEMTGSIDDIGWTWMDEMSSPAVIEHIIVMRLMKANLEMTIEQASDIVTVEAIAEMTEEMSALIGLDAFTTEGEEPGEVQSG